MITITEEKLLEIAKLADKCQETHNSRWGYSERPKTGEEITNQIFENLDVPTLPELKLNRVLHSLSDDEICQLQALMWLGRNSYINGDETDNAESYQALYREAKTHGVKYAVEYISAKFPSLAGYIKRGMIIMNVFEKQE